MAIIFKSLLEKTKSNNLKIKEVFDKSNKTEDPGFNKKMNFVKETEKKVTQQF